mmetsp:Transcript_14832/g.46491  ORF Transcript_14832/g.46491 Transcript_14832/m.46491 type:complete len:264 (-) Transcript_14832:22-813(-)
MSTIESDDLRFITYPGNIVPTTGQPPSTYPEHVDPMTFNKWDGLPRYLPYKICQNPSQRLINGAGAGDVGAVRAALADGATVDDSTNNGRTALHISANNGECATIEYLVDRGANVNARRADGRTPLYHAAEAGHLDAVRILVDAGALITVRDHFGGTPLQICQSPAVLAYLESCLAQGIGTGDEVAEGTVSDSEGESSSRRQGDSRLTESGDGSSEADDELVEGARLTAMPEKVAASMASVAVAGMKKASSKTGKSKRRKAKK